MKNVERRELNEDWVSKSMNEWRVDYLQHAAEICLQSMPNVINTMMMMCVYKAELQYLSLLVSHHKLSVVLALALCSQAFGAKARKALMTTWREYFKLKCGGNFSNCIIIQLMARNVCSELTHMEWKMSAVGECIIKSITIIIESTVFVDITNS